MTTETNLPSGASVLPEYVRAIQLRKKLGNIGNSTLRRWVREGHFPKPVKLGANCVAWRLDEVNAWLASRPRYDDVEVAV